MRKVDVVRWEIEDTNGVKDQPAWTIPLGCVVLCLHAAFMPASRRFDGAFGLEHGQYRGRLEEQL